MKFDDVVIQGILLGRRVMGRAPFPGQKDAEVGVKLLTDRETDECRFEAQMYLESQCKKLHLTLVDFVNIDPESLDREHQRQVILRSIRDADSDGVNPFFDNIEQVRGLESALVAQLWEICVDFGESVNPRLKMTQEEVDELAAALKDERSAPIILALHERDTLHSLVRTMASQHVTSQTGRPSTSSN